MLKIIVLLSVIVVILIDSASPVAIYRDTDVLKKAQRNGKQLNPLPFYDDYQGGSSRYADSRWESAEWPQKLPRGGGDEYDTYESNERPYSWFYYNKYLANGRFNHLYNGPHVDDKAGIGDSRNNGPLILPKPAPSFGRSSARRF